MTTTGTADRGNGGWRVCAVLAAAALLVPAAVRADDPFAGVRPAIPEAAPAPVAPRWLDNVQFRREIYGLLSAAPDDATGADDTYMRLSIGFEVLKRFATATTTVATLNLQARLVYRDGTPATAFDAMGADAGRWAVELHNAYVDVYGLAGAPGRLNLRLGRYYLPFGLNYTTDTHATLLQLSNERLFGVDRDWQAVAFGSLGPDVDYAAGFVLGSGPDQSAGGQSGLAMGRVALGGESLFVRGLEGGISAAFGERIDPHAAHGGAIETRRIGADLRRRFDSTGGPVTLTGEAAVGEDDGATVRSWLAQAEWRSVGRRWSAAAQYRRFLRDPGPGGRMHADERRAALVFTRYLRNDVGGADLHWLAVGVEREFDDHAPGNGATVTVQYYRYW